MAPRRRSLETARPLRTSRYSVNDDASSFQENEHLEVDHATRGRFLPTTMALPVLVFIDMLAVSLVVPLLFQYFKEAGITSATQRELLSSLYSASQIAGGILMGVVSDTNVVQRRTILIVSFVGSALSYGMISHGGIRMLIASRLLVGFVKQTMTIATTIVTRSTPRESRAKHMGRLAASTTMAWVIGPSVGALLFKYLDPVAPAFASCFLFVGNLLLVVSLLPSSDREIESRGIDDDSEQNDDSTGENRKGSIVSNLRACFTSRRLGSVVVARLIFTWVMRATSYAQLGSFYEDMYGLEPHHRGYLSSYQQFLRFVVQSSLVSRILRWAGGERRTVVIFSIVVALATLCESFQSLPAFLLVICPLVSLSTSMSDVALRTLLTHVAPSSSVFSVLASLDVLQNAASVTVPFYRTLLFRYLAPDSSKASMEGDPDPVSWIFSSTAHWLLVSVLMAILLLEFQTAAPSKRKKEI